MRNAWLRSAVALSPACKAIASTSELANQDQVWPQLIVTMRSVALLSMSKRCRSFRGWPDRILAATLA